MIGATFCSGIGAPEVAAPWVDWQLASEIEPFPRAVLKDRFGYVDSRRRQDAPRLWGDFTALKVRHFRRLEMPLPQIIVAGTPCQAFSIAGLREGTADPRGNLTLQFVRTCHAIANARPDGKLCVLWENVPGVLSDKGNAFGSFLGGLVGAVDALRAPGDKSWPGEGMVQGPRARAAWAVLDAQWFGVAQRRRRVFVVVDFGNCVDPAAVLLELDRLRGDSAPRRETGEDVAGSLAARTGGSGGLGTDFDCDGGLVPSREVSQTLLGKENCSHREDAESYVAVPIREGQIVTSHDPSVTLTARDVKGPLPEADLSTVVAHSLRGEGFDASEDGTGRATPIVPIAIQERAVSEKAKNGPQGAGYRTDGVAYTLEARNKVQAVAFDLNQVTCATNRSQPDPQVCHTLPATSCPPHLASAWAVRRLMPVECHRLQGFADDHCAVTYRGKTAADGPQYKALGNSMAVPVIRWIMDRIRISMEAAA